MAEPAVERFRRSMTIDHEKWHDGIGYDLEALAVANDVERQGIEQLLLARGVQDWRDVEALATLDTSGARAALQEAARRANAEVRVALLQRAPYVFDDAGRVAALVDALEHAEAYGGLTQALLQVEEFHPPAVIDALFHGVLRRDGETAVHLVAMLMFCHGRAESSFDWEQRPYFLRFHTEDPVEREGMFRDLCARLGVSAERYLAPGSRGP